MIMKPNKKRNPMINEFIDLLMLSAPILMTGSLTIIIFALTLATFYHFVVRVEEAALLEKFGDSYSNYLEQSGRFLPSLIRRR